MTQFDGPNRRIILEPPTSSVLNVVVQEDFYSEWKQWTQGFVNFNTEDDVSSANERITKVDHSTHTGQRVQYQTNGGLESIGLTDGAYYFVRVIDRNTFELYDTEANAEAGPSTTGRLDLTASGVGNGEIHRIFADNAKFPQAFRTVGGDPLTPGVEAGAYFFMQNQAGFDWRIISSDEDQTVNYNGNLVGEDAAVSLIVPTPGRTVLHLGLQPVTQRVDEILTQSQVAAYNGQVAIDVLSTNAGTVFPAGTLSSPVNNINDAAIIAANLGVSKYLFAGSLTLDRDFERSRFIGGTSTENDVLNFGGFSVDATRFDGCSLEGTYTGSIEAEQCQLRIILGMNGVFRRCGIADDVALASNAAVVMDSCFSEIPGGSSPVIDCDGALELQIRNYSGGVRMINMNNASFVGSIDIDPGTVEILDAQGNTAGMLQVRGVGTKVVGDAVGTSIIDKVFDVVESQIAFASLVGNVDISLDDLSVSILDRNLNNLRELSVSPDLRTRRIV